MSELLERKVGTKDKNNIVIKNIELERINNNFDKAIGEIKNRQQNLKKKNKLDEEDTFVLGTQVVFLESAFDYYIHEIITYGIVKIYNGEWEINEQFESILVKLNTCISMIKEPEFSAQILREYIIEYFGGMTFLDKKNLNSKLKIIGIKSEDIASKIYVNHSRESGKQKFAQFIDDLYSRRNRIVHQFDMKFGSNEKCDICIEEVDAYIVTIEKIVKTISDLVIEK